MMRLIGITGGIGSGKSVVSQVLASFGYKVYNCDKEAKRIMDMSETVKKQLSDRISADVIDDSGCIRRSLLSEIVFSDKEKLLILNDIVHASVREDVQQWLMELSRNNCKTAFIESAILFASHLDEDVDAVWKVTAPLNLRISRVMSRDGLSRDHILRRIESQQKEERSTHHHQSEIVNDERQSLLLQIDELLASLSEQQ